MKTFRQLANSKFKLNGPGAVPMLAYNTPAWKSKGRPKRMLLHQHEVRFTHTNAATLIDTNQNG